MGIHRTIILHTYGWYLICNDGEIYSLKWCFNHKFYVKITKVEKQKEEAIQLCNIVEHIINLLESDDKRYSFEGGTGHSIRIYDKETDIGYVGHFEPIKYDADGNATNL